MAQTDLVDKYCAIANPVHDDDTWLPEHLAFDEFRGVGRKLHFIALDGITHQVVKILQTRYKHAVMAYFRHYPEIVRRRVKTVSMDLNYYYAGMAKEPFPNAQVILDRFHVVQMLNRSFNACRIQVMKQYSKASRNYRLLKYFWKLEALLQAL
ncbi:transposase [Lactobacillus sp. M0396]|uniref:transposase n=1 Tax=Lactobacillus sp. M0396 TaxID=2751030 RepID=UPI0018DC7DBB|nr:transposase [Lactobacillus sp. M0396]MBI0033961.1 transposase [Lactobacillus sp. M0396]